MCVRERALPSITDGLYSEAVAAGLSQSLDFVGVAGTAVDRHKPGHLPENIMKKEGRDNESHI